MDYVPNIIKQPFSVASQAWSDYQLGRSIRNSESKEEDQVDSQGNEEPKSEPSNPSECIVLHCPTTPLLHHNLEANPPSPHKSPAAPQFSPPPPPPPPERPAGGGWEFRKSAEFPWRLQQVVVEESNWRGTWVLEVKDMQAMDWGTAERVPKEGGRGGRYPRGPTRHLPFTPGGEQTGPAALVDGGQDDLMVWLGKR